MSSFRTRFLFSLLFGLFVYLAPNMPALGLTTFARLPHDPPFWVECTYGALIQQYPQCVAALFNRNSPVLYAVVQASSVFAPFFVALVLLSVSDSIVRVWLATLISYRNRGKLPPWPLSPTDESPSLVIGELHYKDRLAEHPHPKWLLMPEKGLYTGLIIFGAIGTGKTTSCMRPFCRQLLEWQRHKPELRCAMLVLEVKGDFCYDVQEMLAEYKRTEDYMELSLDEDGWKWNPLDCPWLDTYSLAYTLASLVNQLFGKSKEPFWQQAYTSTIKWIIECHRSFPDPWFTFADIHRAMVSGSVLAALVQRNCRQTFDQFSYRVDLDADDYERYKERVSHIKVTAADVVAAADVPEREDGSLPPRPPDSVLGAAGEPGVVDIEWKHYRGRYTATIGDVAYNTLLWELAKEPSVSYANYVLSEPPEAELALTTEISRWHEDEWLHLDEKLRSSIVIGMSVFLGIFVVPRTANIFCPPNPAKLTDEQRSKIKMLPRLQEAIETGKVLALNMPAGESAALARASGVMLKQSYLSTLLLRPKAMKLDKVKAKEEKRAPKDWRPAVFICDEYQAFVTCGEDDPSGDEKAFALTRQSKCVPIVATQSLASLKSVLGDGESWRALLQTLRSRIFLSLADDFSQKTASELLGQVNRMQASYSLSENTGKASASLLTGKVGGGTASAGISKSYSQKREALFHPRDLSLLGTCQAICQIFDGAKVSDAQRVYLKPDYKPRDLPYWRWYEKELAPKAQAA